MANNDKFTIFLSSTFRDLKNERQAVTNVILRAGEHYSGMEYFGATTETPLDECMKRVDECDVFILVVAQYPGSIPKRKRTKTMVECEYERARESGKPILVFLSDDIFYPPATPPNRRIARVRKDLLARHTVSYFSSPLDLAQQVAVDLGTLLNKLRPDIIRDAQGELAGRHNEVVQLIRAGQLDAALSRNSAIIKECLGSARAHFNQACIYSLLGKNELEKDPKDLRAVTVKFYEARSRLFDAFGYRLMEFFRLFCTRPEGVKFDPRNVVLYDPDLEPLFNHFPSLRDEVRKERITVDSGQDCTMWISRFLETEEKYGGK